MEEGIKGINTAGQALYPPLTAASAACREVLTPSFPHLLGYARASTVATSLRSSIRKSYFTIPEAAKLKGIDEEELWSGIREGRIETKKIGMPAAAVFGETTARESDVKAEQYLEQLKPYPLDVLRTAPEFGSCGIAITFHGGKITKINKQHEVTKLEEKWHG